MSQLENQQPLRSKIEMYPLMEHVIDEINAQQLAGLALAGTLAFSQPTVAHAGTQKSHGLVRQEYSMNDIVKTIVGESSGEGYEGMLAVSSAIRNRAKHSYYRNNVLHGAYGKNAPHIKTEAPSVFAQAEQAWLNTKNKDYVNGGYIWGNASDVKQWQIQASKNPKFWFNNLEQCAQVKGHYFFRDKKRKG